MQCLAFFRFFMICGILLVLICAPSYAKDKVPFDVKGVQLEPVSGPLAGRTVYANSWALLVGIDRYKYLPPQKYLHYAVKDVTDLRDMLVRYYGFLPNHIIVLRDSEATKLAIEDNLDALTDSNKVGKDDRVLIFFSGHGATVTTDASGDMGFLVPTDAEVDLLNPNNIGPYNSSCLSMSWIRDTLQSCPAKHVLLLADACYSGLLAHRDLEPLNTAVVAEDMKLLARQVITAGEKGQKALERPDLQHGVFTYKLLEQLQARTVDPGNIFTAGDLFNSLYKSVTNFTNGQQIPQLGNFNTEGNFLFITTKLQPVPSLGQVVMLPPSPPSSYPPITLEPSAPDPPITPVPLENDIKWRILWIDAEKSYTQVRFEFENTNPTSDSSFHWFDKWPLTLLAKGGPYAMKGESLKLPEHTNEVNDGGNFMCILQGGQIVTTDVYFEPLDDNVLIGQIKYIHRDYGTPAQFSLLNTNQRSNK